MPIPDGVSLEAMLSVRSQLVLCVRAYLEALTSRLQTETGSLGHRKSKAFKKKALRAAQEASDQLEESGNNLESLCLPLYVSQEDVRAAIEQDDESTGRFLAEFLVQHGCTTSRLPHLSPHQQRNAAIISELLRQFGPRMSGTSDAPSRFAKLVWTILEEKDAQRARLFDSREEYKGLSDDLWGDLPIAVEVNAPRRLAMVVWDGIKKRIRLRRRIAPAQLAHVVEQEVPATVGLQPQPRRAPGADKWMVEPTPEEIRHHDTKRREPESRIDARFGILGRASAETRDTPRYRRVSQRMAGLVVLLAGGVAAVVALSWPYLVFQTLGPSVDLASTRIDDTFVPGANLPWRRYGQDFGKVDRWTWDGVSRSRAELDALFGTLRQQGVRTIVWFLLADGRAAPEFDANGFATGLDAEFWEDYDAAIDLVRRNDLSIVWVLIDWKWMLPLERTADASLAGHADVIEDRKKRASFFEKVFKPILLRHRFERHVAGWILMNEPENALKDGYVSPRAVSEFTMEAAALIKEHAPRPISIGRVSLESLMAHQAQDAGVVDFYAFHHYRQFLPPPADHVRAMMAAPDTKPIYIGEFDLSQPLTADVSRLAGVARALRYAGMWPWAVFAKDNAPPLVAETESYAASVTGALRGDRPTWDVIGPSAGESAQRTWWLEHGRTVVLPRIASDVERLRAELALHEREIPANRDIAALTESRITKETDQYQTFLETLNTARNQYASNLRDYEASASRVKKLEDQLGAYHLELKQANAQLEDNRKKAAPTSETVEYITNLTKWIADTEGNLNLERSNHQKLGSGVDGAATFVKNAEADLDRSAKELEKQKALLPEYRRRLDSHTYLLQMTREQISWQEKLYNEFWKNELLSSPSQPR